MELEGIVKVNRNKNSTINENIALEHTLDGCKDMVDNVRSYHSDDYYGFGFEVVNVLAIDKLLSNVREKFKRGTATFRLLKNGYEMDLSMLK